MTTFKWAGALLQSGILPMGSTVAAQETLGFKLITTMASGPGRFDAVKDAWDRASLYDATIKLTLGGN